MHQVTRREALDDARRMVEAKRSCHAVDSAYCELTHGPGVEAPTQTRSTCTVHASLKLS